MPSHLVQQKKESSKMNMEQAVAQAEQHTYTKLGEFSFNEKVSIKGEEREQKVIEMVGFLMEFKTNNSFKASSSWGNNQERNNDYKNKV
jgi:hypothetical protein